MKYVMFGTTAIAEEHIVAIETNAEQSVNGYKCKGVRVILNAAAPVHYYEGTIGTKPYSHFFGAGTAECVSVMQYLADRFEHPPRAADNQFWAVYINHHGNEFLYFFPGRATGTLPVPNIEEIQRQAEDNFSMSAMDWKDLYADGTTKGGGVTLTFFGPYPSYVTGCFPPSPSVPAEN